MRFQIVDLEQAWWGKIEDFSVVRNRFIEKLPDDEYILWKSADEEMPESLLEYIRRLKPAYPYYDILRINLVNDQWVEWANPRYSGSLVSNRVRYKGRLHEQLVPSKPYGKIDIPIIHNQHGPRPYNSCWKQTRAYRPVLAYKKFMDVMIGR